MKTILLMMSIIISSLFASCNLFTTQKPVVASPKSLMVIVNDVSKSIHLTDTAVEHQTLWLKKYFSKNLRSQSDVVLLAINSASSSQLNTKWLYSKSPENKKSDDFQSETDSILEASNREYDNRIQKIQLQNLILATLKNQSQHNSADQSEIIELMPLLQHCIKNYNTVNILFISDLYQSSSRRCFNSQMLLSKSVAEEYGLKDAKAMAYEYSLPSALLSQVHSITILVPTKANDTYEILPFYYEAFYGFYGFKKPLVWEAL